MAVVLRRNLGTALTYDQLDDNFVDYTEFRDKFDQTDWVGAGDGKVLFYDNNTGKIKIKTLSVDDIAPAFGANFNSNFALKTTDDLTEGSNLYYTTTRANTDFDTRLATKSTTDLAEGSRLYYTDARVLTKINATSVTALSDMPSAVATDDAKVVTYDANTSSFRYASMLTESLLPVTDHGLITDGNVVTGSTGVTTTSLESLTNVNFASVSGAVDGNVLVYDSGEWKAGVVTGSGGVPSSGATNFLGLSDTPGNFSLQAGKLLKVNNGETGIEFGNITTSDVGESGSSYYFTDSRFDGRLATKTTDDIAEGSTNLYYTDTRADSRVALHTGANLNLSSKTSDDLAEGTTNLYYTDTRADARITAAGSANWNTAFGWGDHASAGYQTTASLNSDIDAHLNQTNPTAGYVLSWNGADYVWVVQTGGSSTLAGLSDTTITTPSTGQVLKYNGSAWVNDNDAGGPADTDALAEGSTNLYYTNARVDAHLNQSNPTAGYVLSWNGSDYAWVDNGTPAGADTQVQFNSSGSFGADADFTYNSTTNTLTVVNLVASSIAPPSTLTGTYSITSPTTITLDPTDEIINDAPMKLVSKTVSQLGSLVSSAGAMVYCTDESGGAIPAFYDGTNWRRVSDRAIVS